MKDGGYNNITNTSKVSRAQNTPALQARPQVSKKLELHQLKYNKRIGLL